MTRLTPKCMSSYSEEPAREREKDALLSLVGGCGFSASFLTTSSVPAVVPFLTLTSCSSSLAASASSSSSRSSSSLSPSGPFLTSELGFSSLASTDLSRNICCGSATSPGTFDSSFASFPSTSVSRGIDLCDSSLATPEVAGGADGPSLEASGDACVTSLSRKGWLLVRSMSCVLSLAEAAAGACPSFLDISCETMVAKWA
mmetsp:Transcript_57210/g.177805  ORF Transcript_57210/g.177805 Transcript_57210/m.177805 type:complete len:201 (-) Transcript_57210:353-955(-)